MKRVMKVQPVLLRAAMLLALAGIFAGCGHNKKGHTGVYQADSGDFGDGGGGCGCADDSTAGVEVDNGSTDGGSSDVAPPDDSSYQDGSQDDGAGDSYDSGDGYEDDSDDYSDQGY